MQYLHALTQSFPGFCALASQGPQVYTLDGGQVLLLLLSMYGSCLPFS